MAPRSLRVAAAASIGLLLLLAPSGGSIVAADQDKDTVGAKGLGRTVLPVNQIVTPYGTQSTLPGLRPQALALSPDGKLLAVAGKTHELLILDPLTGRIAQQVVLPAEEQQEQHPEVVSPMILDPDEEGQLSYTGLIFAPGGRRIYMSNVDGSIKVFSVDPDGTVEPSHTFPLPLAGAPRRAEEIPAGLAVTPDGQRLYVCGNLSNRLLELDTETGEVVRTFDVGVAPFDVVLAGGKAYVSNWGGRRPVPGDLTGPAGRGTEVRVDPVRHIASEGSVSVVDLAAGALKTEVLVHLHASALALSPDGRWVVCANAASDNLSVIATATDTVVETIWAKSSPADLFGASPNALAFSRDGKTLYAANGTQNAVASIKFKPRGRKSALKGLIPVGWFPGALALDGRRGTLYVANIKGHAVEPAESRPSGAPGFNSHMYHGSVSFFPEPRQKALWDLTGIVDTNFRRERMRQALQKPRPGQPARPVPERIGEPSVFKHVVYIIKENRTYDQVLGDVAPGNGDPALCIFGEKVTPNQHKLVRDFVLLDNTYCSGILSADGHQWSTTAFGTDYLERSFAGWPRSYPDGMGPDEIDALAYAPSGFIWDNALKHGVSLWNFGEFTMQACGWKDPERKGDPQWADYWDEYLNGRGEVRIGSTPAIPSVAPFSPTDTLGWNMDVPDQWRARYIVEPDRGLGQRGPHAPAHLRLPARRPHERHERGLADARGLRRRQRPRLRPHRRGLQPQLLLEGDGRLRHRGRSPERLGPRQRLPDDGLLRQPVHEARRRRQHPVQHDEPAPDDRADPRPAAHEPVRRHGDADVRLLHRDAGLRAFRDRRQHHPPRHDEPAQGQDRRRPAPAARHPVGTPQLRADRRLPRGHAQPHPLARREGQRRPLSRLGRDPRR